MKFSNKETEKIIKKAMGDGVFSLVKILKGKKGVSEIKLAEYCNKELNKVRSDIYKLHNFNLVSFTKRKDKHTNLYVYYWSLDVEKINAFLINYKKKELNVLKEDLVNEKNNLFYSCVNKCERLNFEMASECGFKCPECNNLLDYEKHNKKIDEIIKKINCIKTTI